MSSPSELFSCVNATAILRSPLNCSTAKNQWTISKSARFPSPKIPCHSIYNIPDTKSKRKTILGYGKKTDLDYGKHPHNITPPPNAYTHRSFIQENKAHQKGFTPGKGRDETEQMSYIDLQPIKVPGPGTYHTLNVKTAPSWSLRPKTASQLFPSGTIKIVPGPGKYQSAQSMSGVGKYYTSKHRCSGSKNFNPTSSKRFAKSVTEAPGVGAYNPKNDLSGLGIYVLSKNVSSGRRAMLNAKRESFVDTTSKLHQTPGPGSYRIPSQFGQYDQTIEVSKSTILNKSKSKRVRPQTSKLR